MGHSHGPRFPSPQPPSPPNPLHPHPNQYGIIFTIATALLWRSFPAVVALANLCFGDAFAAMVGRAFGRHRWRRGSPKTVEGSAAFVGAAFLACYAARACATPGHATALPPWETAVPVFALTGAVGAAVELLSPELWDNLAVFLATLPVTLYLL